MSNDGVGAEATEALLLGTDEEKYAAPGRMTAAQYDRMRQTFADEMGIRIATLDFEVQRRRRPQSASSGFTLSDAVQWTEEVCGAAEDPSAQVGLSDELALCFTERHADELRYVAVWDRWLIWDGVRWAADERRRVFDMARALCRDTLAEHQKNPALAESQRKGLRQRLGSAATIWVVVKLAGSDPRHAVTVSQLDADPWALNTPGGALNLRTGEMRAHQPSKLHTMITAATPGGECPLFLSSLERVQPDPKVRDYLQRLAGYALTGSSREHVLPFFFGLGRNGKGTIAHALRRAMGDYGLEVAPELLMESHNERHPTELAVLRGARFVVGSEVDTGRRWNESRLKRLTGGDPISARYIGRDLFEFEPNHTLIVVGNTKPGLRSVDEAMRTRVHVIEFGVTIPERERDTTLAERLQPEYGGILAWALAGCLGIGRRKAWRRQNRFVWPRSNTSRARTRSRLGSSRCASGAARSS